MDTDEAGRILQGYAPADEFLQFIRALVEADRLDGEDGLIYLLEKPWKYADEFAKWDSNGRPLDASEAGWEAFLEAIEQ